MLPGPAWLSQTWGSSAHYSSQLNGMSVIGPRSPASLSVHSPFGFSLRSSQQASLPWRQWERQARDTWPADEYARAGGYLTIGSHNMDYRGMLMNGEVIYVTSGLGIYPAFPDFLTLLGDCTWVGDPETLYQAMPEYPEWQRQVGRYIKYAL